MYKDALYNISRIKEPFGPFRNFTYIVIQFNCWNNFQMAVSLVWRAKISKTAKSWCLPKNMYNHKTVPTVHRKHIQSQCCSFGVTSVIETYCICHRRWSGCRHSDKHLPCMTHVRPNTSHPRHNENQVRSSALKTVVSEPRWAAWAQA